MHIEVHIHTTYILCTHLQLLYRRHTNFALNSYPQNDLVVVLGSLKFREGLMQPAHVVGSGHSQPVVVGLVLNGFLLASLQRLLIETLNIETQT